MADLTIKIRLSVTGESVKHCVTVFVCENVCSCLCPHACMSVCSWPAAGNLGRVHYCSDEGQTELSFKNKALSRICHTFKCCLTTKKNCGIFIICRTRASHLRLISHEVTWHEILNGYGITGSEFTAKQQRKVSLHCGRPVCVCACDRVKKRLPSLHNREERTNHSFHYSYSARLVSVCQTTYISVIHLNATGTLL